MPPSTSSILQPYGGLALPQSREDIGGGRLILLPAPQLASQPHGRREEDA